MFEIQDAQSPWRKLEKTTACFKIVVLPSLQTTWLPSIQGPGLPSFLEPPRRLSGLPPTSILPLPLGRREGCGDRSSMRLFHDKCEIRGTVTLEQAGVDDGIALNSGSLSRLK